MNVLLQRLDTKYMHTLAQAAILNVQGMGNSAKLGSDMNHM